jgi:hypothetical protein
MKKELPFVVNYTKEMSDKFNKELMESGYCPMSNPKFYGKWDLVEVGSAEYNEKVKVKRQIYPTPKGLEYITNY